jgi:hypothetical protein
MAFEVKCAGTCGETLRLLKDSTEGQKVFCGWCHADRVKELLEKKEDEDRGRS